MKTWKLSVSVVIGMAASAALAEPPEWIETKGWNRHTIDNSSIGADGVRLADVNGDGLMDIATGWEEGGIVRVYLNPGHEAARQTWPAVTVGRVASPEDAVFADVDGDGAMDVISACEGNNASMYVHWAPSDPAAYLDEDAWQTQVIPVTEKLQKWMFSLPVPDQSGVRILAGAKGDGARLGWLLPGDSPRDVDNWKWIPADGSYEWIMSLMPFDLTNDGETEVVISNRKGSRRGIYTAGTATDIPSFEFIGGGDLELMFLDVTREAGEVIITSAVRGAPLLELRKTSDGEWQSRSIPLPANTGTGKAVRSGDMNGDGIRDLVVTCEHAEDKHGAFWLEGPDFARAYSISGLEGIKYDRIELIDLDGDGDLDVLTCEERSNLGVIWYENPLK
jgi:hypothetical protein